MVLDKALTDDDVRRYLNKIKGRGSRIYTTTCICDIETGRTSIKTAEARLKMKYLQPDEIEFYIKTKQGIGKAGGYGIGDFACCLFEKISRFLLMELRKREKLAREMKKNDERAVFCLYFL